MVLDIGERYDPFRACLCAAAMGLLLGVGSLSPAVPWAQGKVSTTSMGTGGADVVSTNGSGDNLVACA
jgi:hypothetical protein